MELVTAQVCKSNAPWASAYVLSHTEPGKVYEILVPFPGAQIGDYICDCIGYKHRGYCSHQSEATLCHWRELEGPENQDEAQRAEFICPRCGYDTFEQLEWVDDRDS